jgi:hypothetical protein
MKPVIPISLKRMAVKNMQAVIRGQLSHREATRRLKNVSRQDIITHLTKYYDPETAKALQYFRLL